MKKTVELSPPEVPFPVTATIVVDEKAAEKLDPHATLSRIAVEQAITTGRWEHENPSIALWLNSAFRPAGRTADELIADLTAHGIVLMQ